MVQREEKKKDAMCNIILLFLFKIHNHIVLNIVFIMQGI